MASAATKDSFFARKQQENAGRPEGLPPNQGGKYVGFGSGGSKPPPRPAASNKVLDDTLSMMTQVGPASRRMLEVTVSAATRV